MNLVNQLQKQDYVTEDILSLVRKTREILHQKNAISDLAAAGTASKTHLYEYRAGKGVCFWIINDIANYAGIEYTIRNFDPALIPQDEWLSQVNM